jgi:hypothetical protein
MEATVEIGSDREEQSKLGRFVFGSVLVRHPGMFLAGITTVNGSHAFV